MGEQGSGKGVWAGLILAVVAAVVFAALWFLRGGDMDALRSGMTRAESAATATVERLEGELAAARNAVAAETTKAADLETRLNDELRAAQTAGRSTESSLRAELAAANDQRARDAVTITGLEQSAAEARRSAGVIAEFESKVAELEQTRVDAHQRATAAEEKLVTANEQANATKTQLEARLNDVVTQFTAAMRETSALREELAGAKSAAETERAAANETAAALRKQITDLETASRNAASAAAARTASAPAITPPAATSTPAAAPNAEVTRLSAALDTAEKARSEVAGQLAAARTRAVERETAHRDANETLLKDIAALRKEITALRESASDTGTPEVKRLVDSLASAERARAELAAQLDAARKENAEREAELRADGNASRAAAAGRSAELAAFRKNAAESEQIISELSAQFAAANASRDQLLKQTDGLRLRLSAAHKRTNELEASAAASKEQLLKQANGLRERLSASRKHANELETTLAEKVAALEKETQAVREQTSRLVADMRVQLNAAKTEAAKQAEAAAAATEAAKRAAATVTVSVTPPAAVTTPVPAAVTSAPVPAKPAAPVPVSAPAITNAQRPTLTIVSDPQKHFGQLVELLSDGKTWLVSTAGGKGLKVGSRFDIHRDANNRILYIGQLEIVSLLPDGFAMAALRPDDAPVGICPATGRAVRFAQESPFARTADGKAIAPVRSAAPAAAAPAVGDVIDCQI